MVRFHHGPPVKSTRLLRNCLQYIINSYLPNNLTNQLPVLTTQDNQVWVSQGGRIIAAQIEKTDTSTLRSELSSQASQKQQSIATPN